AADKRVIDKARVHDGRVILLGHSMGSIVGYHLLAVATQSIAHLHTLVTFGSPLGLPSVYARMERLVSGTPLPASLQTWDNVWNLKDFATAHDDPPSLFP